MLNLRRITPYIPGEQPLNPDTIKLNTNENPYPPSPGVKRALENFDYTQLSRYPSHSCDPLKQALARLYGLQPDQVFVGNGSDEVLALAMPAFFQNGRPLLFPEITYSFYKIWCELFQIPFRVLPLNKEFHIDTAQYQPENGGILLANPNAPTGTLESLDVIEAILRQNPDSVVLVDEAYIDFGGRSAIELIPHYENILVVQTFSKSRSLAGLRIGCALGPAPLIQALETVKYAFNSYPVDTIAQHLALAALEEQAYYDEVNQKIVATRDSFVQALDRLGFLTIPSATNFVFTTHPDIDACDLFEYLKQQNILIRYFQTPGIDQYLRITIGLPEHMNTLVEAMKNFLKPGIQN